MTCSSSTTSSPAAIPIGGDPTKVSRPGVARVDIDDDGAGCRKEWSNNTIRAPSVVAKGNSKSGLIYMFENLPGPQSGADPWYWTAVNVRTGKVAWRQRAGYGGLYNNHYAGLALSKPPRRQADALRRRRRRDHGAARRRLAREPQPIRLRGVPNDGASRSPHPRTRDRHPRGAVRSRPRRRPSWRRRSPRVSPARTPPTASRSSPARCRATAPPSWPCASTSTRSSRCGTFVARRARPLGRLGAHGQEARPGLHLHQAPRAARRAGELPRRRELPLVRRQGQRHRLGRRVSPVCRQPDWRPDLRVRRVVLPEDGGPTKVVVRNTGRSAAGAFGVNVARWDFVKGATVAGLPAGAQATVGVSLGRCKPGDTITVTLDPAGEVEEADEADNATTVACPA